MYYQINERLGNDDGVYTLEQLRELLMDNLKAWHNEDDEGLSFPEYVEVSLERGTCRLTDDEAMEALCACIIRTGGLSWADCGISSYTENDGSVRLADEFSLCLFTSSEKAICALLDADKMLNYNDAWQEIARHERDGG